MDVKADHCTAGLGIHLNFLNVQGVDGKDIAMGLAFWRSRAAVSGLAKIGTFMGLLTAVWFTRMRKNAVLTVTES